MNEATWCDIFPNVPPDVYKAKVVDIFIRLGKDWITWITICSKMLRTDGRLTVTSKVGTIAPVIASDFLLYVMLLYVVLQNVRGSSCTLASVFPLRKVETCFWCDRANLAVCWMVCMRKLYCGVSLWFGECFHDVVHTICLHFVCLYWKDQFLSCSLLFMEIVLTPLSCKF